MLLGRGEGDGFVGLSFYCDCFRGCYCGNVIVVMGSGCRSSGLRWDGGGRSRNLDGGGRSWDRVGGAERSRVC